MKDAVQMPQMQPLIEPRQHRRVATLEEERWRLAGQARETWNKLATRTGCRGTARCGAVRLEPGAAREAVDCETSQVYFGLRGTAEVVVGDARYRLSPGAALFVPRGVAHSLHGGEETAQVFNAEAAERFDRVEYIRLDC